MVEDGKLQELRPVRAEVISILSAGFTTQKVEDDGVIA
jgi:hypothetical protein